MQKRSVLVGIVFLLLCSSAFSQQPKIEIIGVDAKLQQKNLVVEIIALNKGDSAGSIKITTNYFGEVDERNEAIPADSTKKFTYTIHNAKTGNVKLAIENGVSKFVEIGIPENTVNSQDLFVKEITAENYLAPAAANNQISSPTGNLNPYHIAIAIALIFAAIILAGTLQKRGKFAVEEIKLEKNAELLKQANEAKRLGKIKKIQA